MSDCIKVMIVDDHTLFRQGLRKLLDAYDEVEVIGEASDGKEAMTRIDEVLPDLVLMDIKMPRLDGIDCIGLIKEKQPELNVVVLSMHEDAEYVLKAVDAGASGYMLKSISADSLVDTIKKVHEGTRPLVHLAVDPNILHVIGLALPRSHNGKGLTEQEIRILRLMADGNSNKQIAAQLFISDQTVKGHIHNILQKMDASDRTQAVAVAMRDGLLK